MLDPGSLEHSEQVESDVNAEPEEEDTAAAAASVAPADASKTAVGIAVFPGTNAARAQSVQVETLPRLSYFPSECVNFPELNGEVVAAAAAAASVSQAATLSDGSALVGASVATELEGPTLGTRGAESWVLVDAAPASDDLTEPSIVEIGQEEVGDCDDESASRSIFVPAPGSNDASDASSFLTSDVSSGSTPAHPGSSSRAHQH